MGLQNSSKKKQTVLIINDSSKLLISTVTSIKATEMRTKQKIKTHHNNYITLHIIEMRTILKPDFNAYVSDKLGLRRIVGGYDSQSSFGYVHQDPGGDPDEEGWPSS